MKGRDLLALAATLPPDADVVLRDHPEDVMYVADFQVEVVQGWTTPADVAGTWMDAHYDGSASVPLYLLAPKDTP